MLNVLSIVIFASLNLANCNGVENKIKIYQDVPDNFLKDCLVEINKYRKLHRALPLRWNADLQYHAQNWADHLVINGNLENDIEGLNKLGQGETVSYNSAPPRQRCHNYPPSGDCFACRTTIATWYNESKHYDYESGYSVHGDQQVLHFTQLVWKDTVKVGIATAISPRYGLITVARFRPRGNIGFVDDYVSNVEPPGKEGESEGGQDGVTDPNKGSDDGEEPPCRHQKQKQKRRIEECVNEYGDELCDYYMKTFDGYCKYNYHFMRKHCAKSCDICKVRFPAPAIKETKEDKKLNLRWDVHDWRECHGGLQWREVRCFHRYDDRDYQIRVKHCARDLEAKPAEYKDCP